MPGRPSLRPRPVPRDRCTSARPPAARADALAAKNAGVPPHGAPRRRPCSAPRAGRPRAPAFGPGRARRPGAGDGACPTGHSRTANPDLTRAAPVRRSAKRSRRTALRPPARRDRANSASPARERLAHRRRVARAESTVVTRGGRHGQDTRGWACPVVALAPIRLRVCASTRSSAQDGSGSAVDENVAAAADNARRGLSTLRRAHRPRRDHRLGGRRPARPTRRLVQFKRQAANSAGDRGRHAPTDIRSAPPPRVAERRPRPAEQRPRSSSRRRRGPRSSAPAARLPPDRRAEVAGHGLVTSPDRRAGTRPALPPPGIGSPGRAARSEQRWPGLRRRRRRPALGQSPRPAGSPTDRLARRWCALPGPSDGRPQDGASSLLRTR